MKYKHREQPCGRTVYHWHEECVLVPGDASERTGWIVTDHAPEDRAGCSLCAELDGARAAGSHTKQMRATTPSAPGAIRRQSQNA